MALSTSFKTAIDMVDNTILLASVDDEAGYDYFEFSYTCTGSTYTIRGGSFVACEHGAVHLLEAMGFRFYAPYATRFWKLPAGPLPTNLSQTKMQFWMPSTSYGQTYGNNMQSAIYGPIADTVEAETARFYDLVGWAQQPFPSGHRQGGVVQAFSQFFDANRHLLAQKNLDAGWEPGDLGSFALSTMSPAEKDMVATLAAAKLLKDGQSTSNSLYRYGRTNYDANDGDPNTSDDYFAHAVLVCQKVRAGVNALNTYGYGSYTQFNSYTAYAGVPDAQLGVYAYAGHKQRPSFDVRPYIYVGVALGFSDPATWLPKMVAHKDNSVRVLARAYMGTQTWTNGQPLIDFTCKRNYCDMYDDFYTQGDCRGVQAGDGNGNWLIGLVANRMINMKWRTGSYTYDQALADVVGDLFDDDPAVTELYEYWGNPYQTIHRFSLYDSMLIVDQMVDGWYKDYFEQQLLINYQYMYLPDKPDSPAVGDAYDLALTQLMKDVVSLTRDQIVHSYAYLRRLCNSNVSTAYPHLHFGNHSSATPAPYYTNTTKPTHERYIAARDALAPLVSRAEGLDSENLVLMHNLTPRDGSIGVASGVRTLDARSVVRYIGPGSLVTTGTVPTEDDEGNVITTTLAGEPVSYAAGSNLLEAIGDFVYEWTGGHFFVCAFPRCRIEQTPVPAKGNLWAYIPSRCAGQVKGESTGYIRLHDQNGMFEINRLVASDDPDMNNLGPGQVRWDQASTGFGMLTNMNIWLSTNATKALIPREIAEEDFSNLGKLNKV